MRHRIPLTTIVFNDGAFGNVRRIQEEKFGNQLIASDLANPDFVKLAESFGIAGHRVTGPEALRRALETSLAKNEPTLIEVPCGAIAVLSPTLQQRIASSWPSRFFIVSRSRCQVLPTWIRT